MLKSVTITENVKNGSVMTTTITLIEKIAPEIDGDDITEIDIQPDEVFIRKDKDLMLLTHHQMEEMIKAYSTYKILLAAANAKKTNKE